MSISFPFPVRVAVGIVASGVDRLRNLPGALPSLSVTVVGQAMRASMRVQQEIADLAIRGDEVLGVLGGGPAEHPTWAKFDDDLPPGAAATTDTLSDDDEPADIDSDDEGDGSVVDLPSRSSRRRAGTGPSHTRPARSSSARSRSPRSDGAESAAEIAEAEIAEAEIELETLAEEIVEIAEAEVELETLAEEIAEITEITAEIGVEEGAEISAEIAAELITEAILQDSELDDGAAYGADDGITDGADDGTTLPRYDALSLAELRGHLRRLSADQVVELVERETNGANRAPFLTLLTNRLTTLEHGAP